MRHIPVPTAQTSLIQARTKVVGRRVVGMMVPWWPGADLNSFLLTVIVYWRLVSTPRLLLGETEFRRSFDLGVGECLGFLEVVVLSATIGRVA